MRSRLPALSLVLSVWHGGAFNPKLFPVGDNRIFPVTPRWTSHGSNVKFRINRPYGLYAAWRWFSGRSDSRACPVVKVDAPPVLMVSQLKEAPHLRHPPPASGVGTEEGRWASGLSLWSNSIFSCWLLSVTALDLFLPAFLAPPAVQLILRMSHTPALLCLAAFHSIYRENEHKEEGEEVRSGIQQLTSRVRLGLSVWASCHLVSTLSQPLGCAGFGRLYQLALDLMVSLALLRGTTGIAATSWSRLLAWSFTPTNKEAVADKDEAAVAVRTSALERWCRQPFPERRKMRSSYPEARGISPHSISARDGSGGWDTDADKGLDYTPLSSSGKIDTRSTRKPLLAALAGSFEAQAWASLLIPGVVVDILFPTLKLDPLASEFCRAGVRGNAGALAFQAYVCYELEQAEDANQAGTPSWTLRTSLAATAIIQLVVIRCFSHWARLSTLGQGVFYATFGAAGLLCGTRWDPAVDHKSSPETEGMLTEGGLP